MPKKWHICKKGQAGNKNRLCRSFLVFSKLPSLPSVGSRSGCLYTSLDCKPRSLKRVLRAHSIIQRNVRRGDSTPSCEEFILICFQNFQARYGLRGLHLHVEIVPMGVVCLFASRDNFVHNEPSLARYVYYAIQGEVTRSSTSHWSVATVSRSRCTIYMEIVSTCSWSQYLPFDRWKWVNMILFTLHLSDQIRLFLTFSIRSI
jgi:hypothetical protein